MRAQRKYVVRRRRVVFVLAAIPSIDCICDQLNNALGLHLGPLSLLQALRMGLLIFFVVCIWQVLRRSPERIAAIPFPVIAATLVLGLAASKELIVTDALSGESVGAYGQMFYWLALWLTVSILCRGRRQASIILRGLACGAFLTACSVILGLFLGVGNFYALDSVLSSAGWFDTAKMITGILVVGGIVALYLGRSSRSWIPQGIAGLCAFACIATYARAGQAALLASTIWLAFWRIFIGRDSEGRWLNRWLCLIFAGCIALPFVANVNTLLARWGDVDSSESAGSGRATFWRIAVQAYENENETQQFIGVGYKSMSEMLFRDYGDDIKHTHNDFLDLLLVGGIAGVLLYASFLISFGGQAFSAGTRTAAGGAAIAVFIAYLCHSQLTGQIWGTDSMTYYALGLTCFSRMSPHKRAAVAQSTALGLRKTLTLERIL